MINMDKLADKMFKAVPYIAGVVFVTSITLGLFARQDKINNYLTEGTIIDKEILTSTTVFNIQKSYIITITKDGKTYPIETDMMTYNQVKLKDYFVK